MQFPLRFPTPTKICHSNIDNSRYRENATKNDNRQSVGSTTFPLRYPTPTKKLHSNIGNLGYCAKNTKNDIQPSVGSNRFRKDLS